METQTVPVIGASVAADQSPATNAPQPAPSAPVAGASSPGQSLFADFKDSLSRLFDGKKFRLKNGQPQLDTKGRFVPLRVGAKRKTPGANRAALNAANARPERPAPDFSDVGQALKGYQTESVGGAAPNAATPEAPASSAPSAETLAADLAAIGDNPTAETIIGIIQTALILIGEEEGVLTPVEILTLRRPLVRTLEKYQVGKDALGPEADLALAVVGLVAARLQKPKTQTAFQKLRAWIVEKFFARRAERVATSLRETVGEAVAAKP